MALFITEFRSVERDAAYISVFKNTLRRRDWDNHSTKQGLSHIEYQIGDMFR